MRILITGSRTWDDYAKIYDALVDELFISVKESWPGVDPSNVTVIHGNAAGADRLAGGAAKALGMTIEIYPANWAEYHRAAGPIRNQQMVDSGADVCLAFVMPGSRGTADCVRRAIKAGIRVKEYTNES